MGDPSFTSCAAADGPDGAYGTLYFPGGCGAWDGGLGRGGAWDGAWYGGFGVGWGLVGGGWLGVPGLDGWAEFGVRPHVSYQFATWEGASLQDR